MTEHVVCYTTHPTNGGLVFASEAAVRESDRMHRALKSTTWGEIRRLLPPDEYRRFEAYMREFTEENGDGWTVPDDTEEFSCEWVPGFSDGDYPPWLQTRESHVLPKSVLHRFGELKSTSNGGYWHVSPEHAKAIVTELEQRGYQVRHEPKLCFY